MAAACQIVTGITNIPITRMKIDEQYPFFTIFMCITAGNKNDNGTEQTAPINA
eukprot:CAMPEP_0204279394 /NCGR_PEP_ID=MMETSP0468-20130131/35042_1 /ASSEMBLY_ACC=CAM_ASM_000383 /TAXON_ID=2969 /ORGANISM="Oxyrrhis marina" /LENGTH=52 /DNA_ID=CAMNT_0051256481 /DNA_START=19 /DNA_END=174 /DNA_ORIENTATION=-